MRPDEGLFDGNDSSFLSFTMLVYWECFFYFYFSMGGRLYDTGWVEEKKGFIYVLLLGRLIHVHGVTSDILTFNSLIIEKE